MRSTTPRLVSLLQRPAPNYYYFHHQVSSSNKYPMNRITSSKRWTNTGRERWRNQDEKAAALVGVVAAVGMGLSMTTGLYVVAPSWANQLSTDDRVQCDSMDDHLDDFENSYHTGYTEAERFYQCLEYHNTLLPDYERRWLDTTDHEEHPPTEIQQKEIWPRRVPVESEIPALELDLQFCLRNLTFRKGKEERRKCENLKFRIASFLIQPERDAYQQRRGFKILKDLAESSHPDGMCLYAIVLNEGRVAGVESDPQQAVVWLRRCVDEHRHIKATFELALAMYIGEGVTENTEFSVRLFRRAAHLGHAGAAYMLGECLLAGVGCERDREAALEWLVTAAELGHQLARSRVFSVLQMYKDYATLQAGQIESERRRAEEHLKWMNTGDQQKTRAINIERRYSIGGGSRNPHVLAQRRSIIAESRGEVPCATDTTAGSTPDTGNAT